MSLIVSRRPSSRNHWNEAFWIAIRLGRSRTFSIREKDLRARGEATVVVKEEASLGDVRNQAIEGVRGCGRAERRRNQPGYRLDPLYRKRTPRQQPKFARRTLATEPPPVQSGWLPAISGYLSSTSAPASSSWALIVSASSWLTPSLTGFGAESTRSLASLRPSPVTARTTLITWIFWPPASVRTTSNAVFSSASAAPPAPGPLATAAATGAAAVMPHSSSILFSSTSSRTVMLPSCSKMVSTAAISGLLVFCGFSGGFRGRFCLGLGGRSFLRCLLGGRLLGGFGRVGGG